MITLKIRRRFACFCETYFIYSASNSKALEDVVEHLVRRHKRQTTGDPPAGGESSWMDKVGGYLDTVGEWLNTANGMGSSIMGE